MNRLEYRLGKFSKLRVDHARFAGLGNSQEETPLLI
jgi:hypothetical protein